MLEIAKTIEEGLDYTLNKIGDDNIVKIYLHYLETGEDPFTSLNFYTEDSLVLPDEKFLGVKPSNKLNEQFYAYLSTLTKHISQHIIENGESYIKRRSSVEMSAPAANHVAKEALAILFEESSVDHDVVDIVQVKSKIKGKSCFEVANFLAKDCSWGMICSTFVKECIYD